MKTFEKKIETKVMEDIRNRFYKTEALNNLVKDATNEQGAAVVAKLYADAYTDWQIAMNTNEAAELQDICRTFIYDYSIDFNRCVMSLTTSDNTATASILEKGFVEV